MTRALKPSSEIRRRTVPLLCTDSELDALHRISERERRSMAELLREAIHSQYPSDFPPALKVRA
jgi:hypothetical protein